MKILATTDGSARSLTVLPHVQVFANATDSEVMLLRVLDPSHDVRGQRHTPSFQSTAAVREAWERELVHMLATSSITGKATVTEMRKGERIHDAVMRVAEETGAQMIALSSRGSNTLRHALLGSVATGVIGCSLLPVFTAGPSIGGVKRHKRYRLLATSDGSQASTQVYTSLQPFLRSTRVDLRLLQVYVPTVGDRGDTDELADCRRQIRALRESLNEASVARVTVARIQSLTLPDEIVSRAEHLKVDGIAMSTHGHSALHHLLAGSTALAVLARSTVPVILARSVSGPDYR